MFNGTNLTLISDVDQDTLNLDKSLVRATSYLTAMMETYQTFTFTDPQVKVRANQYENWWQSNDLYENCTLRRRLRKFPQVVFLTSFLVINVIHRGPGGV